MVSDSTRAKINDSALYVSFLLMIDSEAPYNFSHNEISAASIYMAFKLIEKKNSDSPKLMNRELFDFILLATNSTQNENKVV